jgi:hypothetical protein
VKTASIGDALLGAGVRFYLKEVHTRGAVEILAELTRFFVDLIVTKAVRYFSRSPVGALGLAPHRLR